jgi:hypothetical protein
MEMFWYSVIGSQVSNGVGCHEREAHDLKGITGNFNTIKKRVV